MNIKINGKPIAAMPIEFTVSVMDLDDADSTTRTADGSLKRDRIAVKRQIDLTYNPLPWATVSSLLKQMEGMFFDVTYPDPMTGKYETKNMYVGNRIAPVVIPRGSEIYWGQLQFTLTER